MRTTAIFSYKGGTGKTTTAINLGAELAARGARVVLVDADGQRNLSTFFGVDTERNTLFDLLAGRTQVYRNLLQVPSQPVGVMVVASSERLATIEIAAMTGGSGINLQALRDLVEALSEEDAADNVIVDCPPSFAPQTVAALVAADDVIIPCTPDCWSVSGLNDVALSLDGARKANPSLAVAGVLLTKTAATAASRGTEQALRAGTLPVFKATIPTSTWAERSTFEQKPLRDCASWTGIARAYKAIAEEYIGGVENG